MAILEVAMRRGRPVVGQKSTKQTQFCVTFERCERVLAFCACFPFILNKIVQFLRFLRLLALSFEKYVRFCLHLRGLPWASFNFETACFFLLARKEEKGTNIDESDGLNYDCSRPPPVA